ncbi:MAG TPA: glycosyltransferase 87 family protein, partial [Reyranella sp.]|nr:glycosyltransferase 87 family protein [Reyranella sp.]
MTGRSDLRIAALFCGAVGLYDLLFVIFSLTRGPVIGPLVDILFPDFLVFHAAARAFFQGKLALVYDIDAFTRFQIASYPDRLDPSATFRPFFYPPIFLLMLLPLGAFAVAKAYGLFMAATAALATAVEGRRDPWGWLAVLLSPAAAEVVLAGQNTFLSLALLYGGLRLLERSPGAAGLLLGALSFKPQLWILVPVALVAARQWRALAWTLTTLLALA